MSPEILNSYQNEKGKFKEQVNNINSENNDYIKSDIYSTALSLIQLCNPDLPLKNGRKTIESKR